MPQFDFNEHYAELVRQLKRKNVVPILGEDMFVYVKDGKETPLQEFIVDTFLSNYPSLMNEELKQRAISEGYHGITLLFNQFFRAAPSASMMDIDKRNIFDGKLEEIVYSEIDNIHIRKDALHFLTAGRESGLFPLIITTSPFDIIERDLHYDFADQDRSEEDALMAENSIYFLGDATREFPSEPCIYHLFGCAADRSSNWASTEKKMINFLSTLTTTSNNSPLKSNLRGKTLFVMGCSLPNWMFRFLLFPLNSNEGIWLNDSHCGTNIDDRNDDRLGRIQLDEYLDDINYKKGNAELIARLTDAMEAQIAPVSKDTSNTEFYDFFISHCTQDTGFAKEIVKILRDKGCTVWVDFEKLEDIKGYNWGKIRGILSRSRHVIPLFTVAYIDRFFRYRKSLKNIDPDSMEWTTLVLMEWANPSLLEGLPKHILENDFFIPILKYNDVIEDTGEKLTNALLQQWINKDKFLPKQFNAQRYFYNSEGTDPDSISNVQDLDWKKLAEGKTMVENSISIDDLFTISDELRNKL